MNKIVLTLILIFSSAYSALAAQENAKGADEMFQEARQLAFSGKRSEARALCLDILKICENCIDARILLGRTYAWDKDYESARKELTRALAAMPDYADARNALADAELWSGNSARAAELYDEGLKLSPGNKEFLYKKAVALESGGDTDGALAATQELLKHDPSSKDGRRLADRIEKSRAARSWSIGYSYDSMGAPFSDWQNISLENSQKTKSGPLYFRYNASRRYNTKSGQFEMDAYPKVSRTSYAYINAGVSNGKIFPDARFGGEIYTALQNGYEGSLGFRYLSFPAGSTRIYTGSLGKEFKSYRITARPFYSNNSGGGDLSGSIAVRKFIRDRDNYATIVFGLGASSYESSTLQDASRLDSKRVSLDWQRKIERLTYLTLLFAFENEEYFPGKHREKYTLGASIKYLY